MKSYIYHILSTLLTLTLVSCAEEGPFQGGALQSDIKVEEITPCTAVISITYPSNNGNLLKPSDDSYRCYLRPSGTTSDENDDRKYGQIIKEKSNSTSVHYYFYDLIPDTSYDLITTSYAFVNGNQKTVEYQDHSFSFKTNKLSGNTAFAGTDYSIIIFSLPTNYRYLTRTLKYSFSPDMSGATYCITKTDKDNDSNLYALIPERIEKDVKIYFDISATIAEESYSSYTFQAKSEMVFNPENAFVPTPSIKTIFSGNDSSIVKYTWPSQIKPIYDSETFVYAFSHDKDFQSYETRTLPIYESIIWYGLDFSEDYYMSIKGHFNICGFNIDTTLYFSGKIDKAPENEKLFIARSMDTPNNIIIHFICDPKFSFEISNNEEITFYTADNNKLFSYPMSACTENTIDFSIPKSRLNIQNTDGLYYTISGFTLKAENLTFPNLSRSYYYDRYSSQSSTRSMAPLKTVNSKPEIGIRR